MENKKQNLKQVFCWLVICCSMIAIMILIGGLTRITDSGLSMVEWNIISGIALYRLCYRQPRKQRIKAYRIRFLDDGAPHRVNPTGISGHDPAKFQRW